MLSLSGDEAPVALLARNLPAVGDAVDSSTSTSTRRRRVEDPDDIAAVVLVCSVPFTRLVIRLALRVWRTSGVCCIVGAPRLPFRGDV